jgi:hypothetical protein
MIIGKTLHQPVPAGLGSVLPDDALADSMESERLLLCRPAGGLNDILCQIGKACWYGEKFNRIVVVDTKYVSNGFADAFSNYFLSTSASLILNPKPFAHLFDALSVVPETLAKRVSSYAAAYDAELNCPVDKDTGAPLTFDFERDYSQELLVHQAWGGGDLSLTALARMRVHDSVVDVLRDRLKVIGEPYDAVHIRHTDYKTDYRPMLCKLKGKLSRHVFLATDNRDAVAFCRAVLGEDRVFSFAKLPDRAGVPLHHTRLDDPYRRNVDAIVDLLMLSLSRKYYFFKIEDAANRYSGFSRLAKNLKNNSTLRTKLIGNLDQGRRRKPFLWFVSGLR